MILTGDCRTGQMGKDLGQRLFTKVGVKGWEVLWSALGKLGSISERDRRAPWMDAVVGTCNDWGWDERGLRD